MTIRHFAVFVLIGLFSASSAKAAGKIYYGSRVGMTVTVKSMAGLDTARAVIRTEHTREDAVGFCKDYLQQDPVAEKCINDELATPLNDAISADCPRGIFTDFFGDKFQFRGEKRNRGEFGPKYILMDLKTRAIADGTSASGYNVNMDIFRALCPRTAPPVEVNE